MKQQDRLKVLDMSSHWSGSVASRHLSHLGADVVKFEPPRIGDGNRGLPPLIEGLGMSHIALNAGKRSVVVDRKGELWSDRLAKAVHWADVVIVSVLEKAAMHRGIDYETLCGLNDQIVYCNISGYGESGPWRDYTLHGLNGDVVAGLVPIESVDGMVRPRGDYRSVGPTLAGIEAAVGILEAVRRRDKGYGSQRVATSVWESAMFWQWRDSTTAANLGEEGPVYADLGSRYAMYETADDRVILLCPIERKFWTVFCDLLNLPADWKDVGTWEASGMDWGKGRDDERQMISERMRLRTLADWLPLLEAAGIPFSPLYSVAEAIETDHARHLNVMGKAQVRGQDVAIPNIPIHLSGGDMPDWEKGPERLVPPPELGADTEPFFDDPDR